MGCLFEIEVAGVPRESAESLGLAAAAIVDEVEGTLSVWNADSEISRLNREASGGPFLAGELLFETLRRAVELTAETDGAFDVTVGPLVEAYGLRAATPRIPTFEELARARSAVGAEALRLRASPRTVEFTRPNMALDLDGIAKGVAVERAGGFLRARGVRDATISAGGSTILSIGPPEYLPPRRVAIATQDGREIGSVELRDEALSTSGNWRRGGKVGNREIGHILDPRTGEPLGNEVLSVTAVAPSAADSDALSTAFAVLGPDASERILAARKATGAVFVVGDSGASHAVLRRGVLRAEAQTRPSGDSR